MLKANGLQFTAQVGEFPSEVFSVVAFELTESLSQLCYGRLQLASTDCDIDASDVLEQSVDLVIWQNSEPLRRFTGVVSDFVICDSGHHRTHYEIVLQSPLWRLELMYNSRIFQGQTTESIASALLQERGISAVAFQLKCRGDVREYCVQHRESDLAFIQRLAAEEGWHYRYGHGSVDASRQPTVIFADHHGDGPRLDAAEYNAKAGGSSQQPAVFRLCSEERVKASAVVMKDYTFKNPAYAMMHEHHAALENQRQDYQHFDYPGRFKADASGKRFTQARLDALRNDANTATGASNRPDFTCGAKVKLTNHNHESMNRDWLLTSVTHTGKQPQALEQEAGAEPTTYHNAFSAIPANKTWRPDLPQGDGFQIRPRPVSDLPEGDGFQIRPQSRSLPRPVMDGPQMAIVTGPEGEEIHCDEHGRVKVRFPWDRRPLSGNAESSANNQHSSAWLRVSQGWAGGQYGFMALPRIGSEVIVSFLDGDPDQPIITGCTYNATSMPPYALPQYKTRTVLKTQTHKGEGSNEVRFEDEAEKQQVYIHAQKNLDLLTENNRTEVIKNDSHLTVEKIRISHVKASEHETIGGGKRERTGKDHSFSVTGTLHLKAGTAWLNEAGTELHIKAGQKVVVEAGAEITLKAGGSFVKIDPSGVAMGGASIKMNAGGGAGGGSGQKVQVPEMPGLVEKNGGAVAPVKLADVGQRANAKPKPIVAHRLKQARINRSAVVERCQERPDGSCPLSNCPCGKAQPV
ncbi:MULTISPECIES: type VI secretion system tip protein TssI/VgrG [unclassified Marinobacter]|uniref:type VI secretion system Vgr family protein n=1 Tax=unclassified Marinobacter TaxID=83889 RepID=UPI00200EF2A8|nr:MULTISPECIES: type VI secretion system tip protein TssI/VgrG [unclassified Marinobacter]UQG54257.1 type VI secretion system tip protein VgrG [Marinobacter sp. M4C]UQG63064.1 type VI secretion system tip protein VgrG [Marinobacter sp. M2C]UQG67342.1 type VI secretion system tip protein VgrG [Marinobacter sp. M1C]